MKLSFISWLMEKGVLTPAQARAVEALIIGTAAIALAAALSSIADWSGSGSFSDAFKTALALGIAAGGQYITKSLRDAAKEQAAENAERASGKAKEFSDAINKG